MNNFEIFGTVPNDFHLKFTLKSLLTLRDEAMLKNHTRIDTVTPCR